MEIADLFTALYDAAPPAALAARLRSDAWLRFALGTRPTHRLAETNRAHRARADEFVKHLDLWRGYRDAVVVWRGRRLRVGARTPPRLVIVTAYNPGSAPRSSAQNRRAQAALVQRLEGRGYTIEPAINGVGTRFVEPSLAVFGAINSLLTLAEQFGQRAIYATVRGRFALVARRGAMVSYAGGGSGSA